MTGGICGETATTQNLNGYSKTLAFLRLAFYFNSTSMKKTV